MAEVDVSSYKRPDAPNPLDTVQKVQNIEQTGISIDQNKLKLVNDQWGALNRELSVLANDPNLTPEKIDSRINDWHKMTGLPAPMLDTIRSQIPRTGSPADLQNWMRQIQSRGQTINEMLNEIHGVPQLHDTADRSIPLNVGRRGVYRTGPDLPRQLPPGTPVFDPERGAPGYLGPAGDIPGLPAGPAARDAARLPIAAPPVTPSPLGLPRGERPIDMRPAPMPPGAAVEPPAEPIAPPLPPVRPPVPAAGRLPIAPGGPGDVAPIVPRSVRTEAIPPRSGPAPISGQPVLYASGHEAYVKDMAEADAKLRATVPAVQALPYLAGLKTGPGTPEFNTTVAFLKNWIPGFDVAATKDGKVDPTVAYQIVNKKLADYLRTRGSRGTDMSAVLDKAASPDPKGQLNEALVKLTQDQIALDRLDAIKPMLFNVNDKKFDEYHGHRSKFSQIFDERVLSLDMMKEEERKALTDRMQELYEKGDAEGIKFRKSYTDARSLGIFGGLR